MNNRQRAALETIFQDPISVNVNWSEVESLVIGAGGTIKQGRGSRVRLELNDLRANFHRPHPRTEARRYQVPYLRDFFTAAGVTP